MKDNITGFTNTKKIDQEAAEWVLLLEDTPQLSPEQIADLNAWIAISDVHKTCLTNMANSWGEMDLLSTVMLPQEIRKPSFFSIILTNLLTPVVALFTLLSIGIKKSNNILRPVVAAPLLCALIGEQYLLPILLMKLKD